MKVTIEYYAYKDIFIWTICDGPDGIDEGAGGAKTLGEVFEQIIIWRHKNAQQYLSDIDVHVTFTDK